MPLSLAKSRTVFRLVMLLALFPSVTAAAAGQSTHARNVGNWQVQCRQGVCLVTLLVTHAGNNTAVVKVDKATMRPDNFGFEVSGNIDRAAGLMVAFAKTTVDSSNPACDEAGAKKPANCFKVKLLTDQMFSAPFLACQGGLCFSRIPGQFVAKGNNPKGIDLLRQFETEDFLAFVYRNKGGHLEDRMLDIDGFKKAYNTALSILSQPSPSSR